MDLNLSAQELAFRDEVRGWLAANLPDDLRTKVLDYHELSKDDLLRWHRTLAARGWVAPAWPVEWGGSGWDITRRYIFLDALQQAPAPGPNSFVINMLGPVLIAFGSEAQKRRLLD